MVQEHRRQRHRRQDFVGFAPQGPLSPCTRGRLRVHALRRLDQGRQANEPFQGRGSVTAMAEAFGPLGWDQELTRPPRRPHRPSGSAPGGPVLPGINPPAK
jgi:hypothetical protein